MKITVTCRLCGATNAGKPEDQLRRMASCKHCTFAVQDDKKSDPARVFQWAQNTIKARKRKASKVFVEKHQARMF